jgi:hypothetical protein
MSACLKYLSLPGISRRQLSSGKEAMKYSRGGWLSVPNIHPRAEVNII